MKKILITYASYGSGHKTIAEYIYEYLKDNKDYEIKIVDILDYTGKTTGVTLSAFNYIYEHRLDKLFSFLYSSMDNKFFNREYKWFFKNFIYNKSLKELYVDFKPDIVFSTHFFGSNVASILKKENIICPKIITLVSDYKVHKMWMSSYDKDEIFIVANNIVKNEMLKKKCYSSTIYPFGLPFNEKKITELISKDSIYRKYNIEPGQKVILFFGGGSYGNERYLKYLKCILKLKLDYQIIFVCGKNEKLKFKAQKIATLYDNVKILGFVNNVYELMEISEMVITKPGGATITECLEMQKFMLLLPGMGGQEKYNARFVCKNNYGRCANYVFTFKIFLMKYVFLSESYKNFYNNKKLENQSLRQIGELIKKL